MCCLSGQNPKCVGYDIFLQDMWAIMQPQVSNAKVCLVQWFEQLLIYLFIPHLALGSIWRRSE